MPMSTKDFFWEIFQATGSIGAYLVYREFDETNNPQEMLVLLEEIQAN